MKLLESFEVNHVHAMCGVPMTQEEAKALQSIMKKSEVYNYAFNVFEVDKEVKTELKIVKNMWKRHLKMEKLNGK